MRAGIALGSNLGDRPARLRGALAAIRAFAGPPVLVSRVYETAPVDCPPGSPSFLNAAVEIEYNDGPRELFRRLQEIERLNERPELHERNSPRTVDLDLLYLDDMELALPNLTLPHPRLQERLFVLAPLADIAPARILPGFDQSIASLLTTLRQVSDQIINISDVPIS